MKPLLNIALPRCMAVAFIILMIALRVNGQTDTQTASIQIQKADFRGKRPQSAVVAALSASRQDVVVVLVRGGSQELITETEGHMKVLIWNGCERIAMITSDLLPDESSAVISIFSNGQTYAVMQDAATSLQTGSDFYKLVRDAYEEDIRPKIKAAASPPTTGGF